MGTLLDHCGKLKLALKQRKTNRYPSPVNVMCVVGALAY